MNDIIQIEKNILYLQFKSGKNARITIVPFSHFISIYRVNTTIFIFDGYKAISIDEFHNESVAKKIEKRIKRYIRNYLFKNRIKRILKVLLKYVVYPLIFILILSSLINVTKNNPVNSFSEDKEVINLKTSFNEQLAEALKIGAETNSIKISSGKEGVLYVFTDPLCPYCQKLQHELEKLANNYSIYLFPVTVISKNVIINEMSDIFCYPKNTHRSRWSDIMTNNTSYTSNTSNTSNTLPSCNNTIIQKNNIFFKKMEFTGTPTIINGNGILMSENIPNTAQAIKVWMKSYEK